MAKGMTKTAVKFMLKMKKEDHDLADAKSESRSKVVTNDQVAKAGGRTFRLILGLLLMAVPASAHHEAGGIQLLPYLMGFIPLLSVWWAVKKR